MPAGRLSKGWRIARALAISSATLGALGGLTGAAQASVNPVKVGQSAQVPAGARFVRALPAASALQATVALNPRSPNALTNYATAVSTPGSSLYRHYITTAQFASEFGPSSAQISAVRAVLRADGLSPSAVSANRLELEIHGSAATFAKAFGTGFAQYRLASGRVAYANTSAPVLPASIAGTVQGVIGLDNLVLAHSSLAKAHRVTATAHAALSKVVTGGPQPCAAAIDQRANGAYTADQLASAYNFSSLYKAGDLGAGQKIAMYELEPDAPSDIATYQKCYGTTTAISYVLVDGGAGTGPGSGEASLDIENAITAAPKAAQLVYQAPNTASGGIDEWNAIISQNKAPIVSTSWGTCEPDSDASAIHAENTLFQEAATQHQSIIDAAGDAGSEDCSQGHPKSETELAVDDPGGQPFVTAVGGTTLTSIGPPPVQKVWNDGPSGGGGGGGISEYFKMPSYQSGAPAGLNVINANSSGTPCGATAGHYCRESPDVTLDADPDTGFAQYQAGAWGDIGGTSGAAPLFAAFIALTNASSTCAGTDVGFANPALYKIAGGTDYSSDFYDVTSGNNDYLRIHSGLYPSGVGYDMASGLGSPNGTTLPAALCDATVAPPAVTAVSPTSGPTSGGTPITITGSGFASGDSVVIGQGTGASATAVPATSVDVVSSTRITAVTGGPAKPGAWHLFVTNAGTSSTATNADLYTYTRPAGHGG